MSGYFLFPQKSIGIELDEEHLLLRLALVRRTRGGWRLLSLKEVALSEASSALSLVKALPSVSALPVSELLVRPFEMALKKTKDIFAALEFHIEPLLPYPLDQALLQAQIVRKETHATSLMLFAIKKTHLKAHLDKLHSYQIEPESVTSQAHALAALTQLLPREVTPQLVIFETRHQLILALVEQGRLLGTRAVDTQCDSSEWLAEVKRTLLSFSAIHKTHPYETIALFSKNEALKTLLLEESQKPVFFPTSPTLSLTQEEWLRYGLVIGMAIASSEINFRQKEFAYPHPFKKLKKPLLSFLCLILLLSTSLFSWGKITLWKKAASIEKNYQALLEKEGREKERSKPLESPLEYSARLTALEKSIRARPNTFPLAPHVPTIKQLLSWLAHQKAPFKLDALHYQMVKYPDFLHRTERYRVRVEIELTLLDPSHAQTEARLFYETLKSASSLIDLKEEIQWLPNKNKYKAVFFLKDRTLYETHLGGGK